MPAFKKRSLSLYLRNGCERQFILYLYDDTDRKNHNMPSRQQRSGLGLVGKAGYDWQFEKVNELKEIFGQAQVHENLVRDQKGPKPIQLADILSSLQPYQFIVEGAYEADTSSFRTAVGIATLQDYYGEPVSIGDTRPDIIQVLPSMCDGWTPATELVPNPYEMGVSPNGDLFSLPSDDSRLRLRVIDVKLTAEPGANYFAEVVYYSMTLAGWLIENSLDDIFVVIGAPAIWPGKHDASELAKQVSSWHARSYAPSDHELIDALELDLEIATFDIFAPRIRSLLSEELPELLSKPWQDLSWHVDYRCKGCEFLSLGKPDERSDLRCFPTAEALHDLSRVYGLSRGARQLLVVNQIQRTQQLARLDPQSSVFNEHQGLRTKRTTFPHRAQALISGETSIIPNSGSDALMPRWPDLRIFLFLDYDLSSAITVTMAIRANWLEPLPYGSTLTRGKQIWSSSKGDDDVFLVDRRTIDREREEFLKFLRQLSTILNWVRKQDADDTAGGRRNSSNNGRNTPDSTYQIYLWDEAQKKHLVRLISRYLPYILQDNSLQELIWLFPPPELLADASESSRKSAVTFVKSVVENTVAIDEPHQYDLLSLAQRMVPSDLPVPSIHDLYNETFSDLIPMERIHEYWTRKGNWIVTQNQILRASRQKVYSLSIVAIWLQKNLGSVLSSKTAPQVVPLTRNNQRLPPISKLWLGFTKLNASLDGFETYTTRAMPPHERVARFRSARLTRRFEGTERSQAITLLNLAEGILLRDHPSLWVYELHQDSVDVNLQRNDFLCALSPVNDYGFFDESAYRLTEGTGFPIARGTVETSGLTSVKIEAIDRTNRLIALTVDKFAVMQFWEQQVPQIYDFSKDVMLDSIHRDFLTDKVDRTLRGIGNPVSATSSPEILQALGLNAGRPGTGIETPASEILWEARQLSEQSSGLDVAAARDEFERYLTQQKLSLNSSQWDAWEHAISKRLTLIWGPPGTGKSRTLRAIILGWLLAAANANKPLRVLVSAHTYTAIENVILELEREMSQALVGRDYSLYWIQSTSRDASPTAWRTNHPTLTSVVLDRSNGDPVIAGLRQQLASPSTLVVVACPPHQLHNLAIGNSNSAQDAVKEWFDVIIVDEASQIDVAMSTLILSKRAREGTCIVAGDDKQLPPILQATPPEGLEDLLGSLYTYFRSHHQISPISLDVNYRSNQTIVEFSKSAGYSASLGSASPELRLNLLPQSDSSAPATWPSSLYWTSDWEKLLDPMYPAVSFVYDDVLSTQVNDFEADAVATLIWSLYGRQRKQLLNEFNLDGTHRQDTGANYTSDEFWQRAVGVVTPHRAQRARIINRLKGIFPQSANLITNAVDTVERYQGQQRDVIFASFGMGDPDLIQAEDEFLYNLNRFNVLTSRARAKVIVFCTQSLVKHLSNDIEVLHESRLFKGFVEAFCREPQSIQLGYYKNGQLLQQPGILRRRLIE